MWRYLVGVGAAILVALGGYLILRGSAPAAANLPPPPRVTASVAGGAGEAPLTDTVPEASARTREEKRFDRYDKDRDATITRDEYLAARRKAFARLDANGDGKLSFEEWAAKTIDRFAGADRDRSGGLSRPEFATTAPKPRAAKPKCVCPAPGQDAGED